MHLDLSATSARALLEQGEADGGQGLRSTRGAEASFELLVRRTRPGYTAPFELDDFLIVDGVTTWPMCAATTPATTAARCRPRRWSRCTSGEQLLHTADEGNGPVNALDGAVRKALVEFFPDIYAIHLVDYKVRIIDSAAGTGAAVRVLIESTDGEAIWTTVGASTRHHRGVLAGPGRQPGVLALAPPACRRLVTRSLHRPARSRNLAQSP